MQLLAWQAKSCLPFLFRSVETILLAEGAAEGVKARGEAAAMKIAAVGKAEAEFIRLRAGAFKKYGDAAVTQLIVSKLPQVS